MKVRKAIVIWLLCGIVLVYVQIVIGGITRLTGSGLSITKWDIVTGTLPPLSEQKWIEAFELYKQTPQYQKINVDMKMGSFSEIGSFKFIYFWEYFHRLWARSMGFIFLMPFIFFSYKNWIPSNLKRDLGIVVALAALAALFGWIMVASGLVHRPWVNAYKLSIHLSIGVSVFGYLLWTFLKYRYSGTNIYIIYSVSAKWVKYFLLLFIIQIFFGGLMSGMKAALFYPSWPDIGGQWIPREIFILNNWSIEHFVDYDRDSFVFSLVHFVHRTVAYLIVILVFIYSVKFDIFKRRDRIGFSFYFVLGLTILQVCLGVITLLKSVGNIPVVWGVLHQGVAVLLFASFLVHMYFVLDYSDLIGKEGKKSLMT